MSRARACEILDEPSSSLKNEARNEPSSKRAELELELYEFKRAELELSRARARLGSFTPLVLLHVPDFV